MKIVFMAVYECVTHYAYRIDLDNGGMAAYGAAN